MVTLTKKEMLALIGASIILGILFGYDDGQPLFEWSYWVTNMGIMMVLSLFSLCVYVGAQKYAAYRLGCTTSTSLWTARRMSFATAGHMKGPIKGIPFGIIIPVIFLFLTRGWLKVASVITTQVNAIPARRLGREFAQGSEYDRARIVLAGPLTALALAFIAKFMSPTLPITAQLASINAHLAFFSMLPVPTLDGMRVYFGSPLLYSFSFILIAVSAILLRYAASAITIIIALITAIAFLIFHYSIKFVK